MTENEIKYIQLWWMHVLLAAKQRECFKPVAFSLEEDSIQVLCDFNENLKLNT